MQILKRRHSPLAAFSHLWRALVLMTLLGFGAVQPSWAISSGCAAIQAYWGGGVTVSGTVDDWQDGYAVTTGEKITYQVTSSGSTNLSNNLFAGAGFALYKNGGASPPADIVVEEYAYDGNELNLNATYTVLANDANHVVYLWSGSSGATSTATVTCQGVSPPSVTNANISISGATGTGGAYKIGDTVTATWNNTAGGDNNSDVTGVTVNFSQFGGGAAVAATNSSGTWTATYNITAGAIGAANRNVSVTATNAGGNTTMADTTNATVDNIPPTVSSTAVSGSPAANATSMAFAVNFNELVGNISTDDFTLASTGTAAGTILGVSASSGSSVEVTVSGISGNGTLKLNLNGGTNIQDAAGNASPAAYSSGATHTVFIPTAPSAPTIGTATA
ncbi:MAG: hypothetical protein KKG67_04455, partial [Gammaproteobacteria bacterium]|nr:hypothetical protein [Gammaproteobacteria bacterium]